MSNRRADKDTSDTSTVSESSEYASGSKESNPFPPPKGKPGRPRLQRHVIQLLDDDPEDIDDVPVLDSSTKISPTAKQPMTLDDKVQTGTRGVPGVSTPTVKNSDNVDGPGGKRKLEDSSSSAGLGKRIPGLAKKIKSIDENTAPKKPAVPRGPYVKNQQKIANLSTDLQSAQAMTAAVTAELEAARAELTRMRNATVTSQDGFLLKRELQLMKTQSIEKDKHIKLLRNAVSFPKWLRFTPSECKSILKFLTMDEVHCIDLATRCNAESLLHWKNALDGLLIPAFDKHVYTTTASLEWVVSRKLQLKHCRVELTNMSTGYNTLGFLMVEGKFDLVSALLSMGIVRLDEVCERGVWAPIHAAAHNDDHRALTFLLRDLQCSTELRDHRGWTALHWAVLRGSARCVEVLLAAGAKLEALTDEPSRTAVHLACQIANDDILNQLINAGAKLDCLDQENTSALLICVNNNSLDCARLLLQFGSPANIPNTSNWTPLKLALHKGESAFLDLFFSQGVDYRMPAPVKAA